MAEADLVHGLLDALDFAAERHRDQRRKGVEASPYINHPIRVALLLVDVGGVRDSHTLAAAILHDTIEDTETTAAEIETRFGPAVRRLVEEVTDDKWLPRHERKRLQVEHAPALSEGAKLIKIADKISNVEDIVIAPPRDWSRERRIEYLEWSEAVVTGCRGVNGQLDSRWDRTCENARERLDLAD
jgi:guanosine-3',5'-bis(diphosphate) 3'-pyrophosphohydrolase